MQLISVVSYPEALFDGYVTRGHETRAVFLLWDKEAHCLSKCEVANWLASAGSYAELRPVANMLRLVMDEWPDDL